jgi:DNA-binding MltR family transcriptional regulator
MEGSTMGVGIALTGPGEAKDRETLASLNRFLTLVGQNDEASMVLALATFIEDTLGRLLVAYFRNCKATKELVEGFNAPLGTLSARTKAAYAFGLLTKEQYQDIEILRKVRNHFAHNWEGVSLERSDIQSMIGQLSGYTLDQSPIGGGVKERLLGTLSTCCIELQVFLGRLESGKVKKAPDVSHRLTTTKPTEAGTWRYVE